MSSRKNSKVKTYKPGSKGKKRQLFAVLIIAILVVSTGAYIGLAVVGGSHKANANQPMNTPPPSATPSPPPSSTSPYPSVTPLTSPAGEYSASSTLVLFITSKGDIVIQMRNDKPITTSNFVNLVKEGYYNDTTFMRVLAGFMIQGGEGKTTIPSIKDEIGNDNVNSNMTIAMANAGANTASSQFFINVANNTYLDTGYTVFGQVIYGQSTVMAISNVPVQWSTVYDENSQPMTPVDLIGAVVMP